MKLNGGVIRVIEFHKHFNKGIGNIHMKIENIRKNKSELKHTISEMKNTLEGISSKVEEAEY